MLSIALRQENNPVHRCIPRSRKRRQTRYIEDPARRTTGIGKFYMGREISLVMGHQGVDRLTDSIDAGLMVDAYH